MSLCMLAARFWPISDSRHLADTAPLFIKKRRKKREKREGLTESCFMDWFYGCSAPSEERNPLLSYSNKIRLLCALRDPAQRKNLFLSIPGPTQNTCFHSSAKIVSADIICRQLRASVSFAVCRARVVKINQHEIFTANLFVVLGAACVMVQFFLQIIYFLISSSLLRLLTRSRLGTGKQTSKNLDLTGAELIISAAAAYIDSSGVKTRHTVIYILI